MRDYLGKDLYRNNVDRQTLEGGLHPGGYVCKHVVRWTTEVFCVSLPNLICTLEYIIEEHRYNDNING